MTVRELVWGWLNSHSRTTFLFSDLSKGLCGRDRQINQLSPSPRAALRAALIELEADGLVSLSPAAHGRGGKPGTQIEVLGQPVDGSTQGGISR